MVLLCVLFPSLTLDPCMEDLVPMVDPILMMDPMPIVDLTLMVDKVPISAIPIVY